MISSNVQGKKHCPNTNYFSYKCCLRSNRFVKTLQEGDSSLILCCESQKSCIQRSQKIRSYLCNNSFPQKLVFHNVSQQNQGILWSSSLKFSLRKSSKQHTLRKRLENKDLCFVYHCRLAQDGHGNEVQQFKR